MTSDPILKVDNIFFSYGEEQIFRNFSFQVPRGGCVAVKGESGTGKTTLFRLLLGFEQPVEGSICYRLNEEEISTMGIRRHSVWLPQDLNLGSGTVHEVIHFPFDFKHNSSRKPEEEKIETVLDRLGLHSDLLAKPFSDLSTGQRQRVGLAICLLLDKPLFLLDEPTSALDENSKQKAVDLLFEDTGRTILSTSHDPWWLDRCDTVIELNAE